jgi:hypothetical protein
MTSVITASPVPERILANINLAIPDYRDINFAQVAYSDILHETNDSKKSKNLADKRFVEGDKPNSNNSELSLSLPSDKFSPFVEKKTNYSHLNRFFDFGKKWFPFLDKYANHTAIFANLFNFFLQTLNLKDETRNNITKTVDFITNMSFIPYGFDGMLKGLKKCNPFQSFGFIMETISVWFSNITTKFLIRGLATGTDQIWVATDYKLAGKYKDGNMLNWKNGFVDVPKASWQLLKEIFNDPFGTLITTKSKGHHAVLSTLGDIVATLGFAITGNESYFGPLRDASGVLFDFELFLREKLIQKLSGLFFILESSLDFLSRFMSSNSSRIAVNSLAHASGRLALSLYKNSDPN